MLKISSQKQIDNDFIDSCIVMAMNFHWSLEEILEMPASRWLVIQERLPKIHKKIEIENKRKSRR